MVDTSMSLVDEDLVADVSPTPRRDPVGELIWSAVNKYSVDGFLDVNSTKQLFQVNELRPAMTDDYEDSIDHAEGSRDLQSEMTVLILYGVFFFLGVVGNALLIVAIRRRIKPANSIRVYVVGLASSDMFFLVACLQFQVLNTETYLWNLRYQHICRLLHWSYQTTYLAVVFILTITSVDRYITICKPMGARRFSTPSRARLMVLTAWLLAGAFAAPSALSVTLRGNTCSSGANSRPIVWIFQLYLLLFGFTVPLLIMAICCILCSRQLRRNERVETTSRDSIDRLPCSTTETPPEASWAAADIQWMNQQDLLARSVSMVFGLMASHFFCWCPKMFFDLLSHFDPSFDRWFPQGSLSAFYGKHSVALMATASSCVYPIVCVGLLRSSWKSHLRSLRGRRGKQLSLSTSTTETHRLYINELYLSPELEVTRV